MALIRNTSNRNFAGKAKDVENLEKKVVDSLGNGTVGQVLTKTSTGVAFSDLPAPSASKVYLHKIKLTMDHTFTDEEGSDTVVYELYFNVYSSSQTALTISDLVNPQGKFVDKSFPIVFRNGTQYSSYFQSTFVPVEGESEYVSIADTTMQIAFNLQDESIWGELIWSELYTDPETGDPAFGQSATGLYFGTENTQYVTLTDTVTEF